jgi:ABC-type Fe3+/spermidine/putrescine transport system ATPase subunit
VGAVQGGLLSDLLDIRGLTVRFGPVTALADLNLTVRRGEMFVLLGGSGSGKTTLLRALGGFTRPDAGTIALDGRDLVPVPPHRRPVNTVFQSGALFPHLSVAANIGFGPRRKGISRAAVAERVEALLALVRLEGFGPRMPHQLSGGQQQRVALARGLAAEPMLLLLDEPLSALDRGLRADTAAELVRLQKRLGTTFILVTHDQQEALTMADRIGVMRGGRMAQVGTPRAVYEAPADRDLAEFMGVANLWDAVVAADGLSATLTGGALLCLPAPARPGPVTLGLRAERLRLVDPGAAEANQIAGVVERSVYAGDSVTHDVSLGGRPRARVTEPAFGPIRPPGPVTLAVPADAIMVFPR